MNQTKQDMSKWENMPLVLSASELSSLLGIKNNTLYVMAKNKKIPARKISNKWRFLKEEIYQWLRAK